MLYPDAGMRLAAARAVAKETGRGWRIAKEQQAHKIDVIVALAMSAFAAVQAQGEPFFDRSWSFVDGRPIGSTPQSEEQRKAQAKQDAADHYANRLQAYLLSHGGGGSFYNRDGTLNWNALSRPNYW